MYAPIDFLSSSTSLLVEVSILYFSAKSDIIIDGALQCILVSNWL